MTVLDRAAATGKPLDFIPFPVLPPGDQYEAWQQAQRLLAPHIGLLKGTHDLADVLDELERGTWQLWLNERTAACTCIKPYPRLKVCEVVLAAGHGADLLATWPILRAWSRERGCRRREYRGRFGWVRMLGLKRGYAVMIDEDDDHGRQ